ncbi:SprT-like domain-containing protein [Paenibacillus agilis]|uniref:SprT-like domain-containing protein n=1 Tax=Paenibacillus agilis TaxID=3020863 RepID=A0A559ID99_9BACL|nr:SprT-like domain-containing protein [Paenibacillus agilis]TVX85639.1 hypothetical protein FPZ44_25140 [Paenibacillus agilis]
MITIERVTEELHAAFRCLNKEFFNTALPEPAITIQSGGKRLTMGWCTTKPIWRDNDAKIKMYEINIAAEYLNIEFYETMDTMLHEMVHLYNLVNNVKDVSRGGQYHNKRFRDECLRRGFYYESNKPDKRLGWSFAKITEETKRIIDGFDIDREVFVIARNTFGNMQRTPEDEDESPVKQKSHIRKYVCSLCGISVRASKEVNIRCDDCDEKMVVEDSEDE